MGRPWWYDSYWEKDRKTQRKPNLSRRRFFVWIGVAMLSLLLGATMTGFQSWLIGFAYYFCRILYYLFIARALLSWFKVRRQNILIVLLDDIAEPILAPLRIVVPRLDVFDITPLIAMGILIIIPIIITRLVS